MVNTERLLWSRNRFKDVEIALIPDSIDKSVVDVIVFLQDKLSWIVGLGYNNRINFDIATYNFWGQPHTFSVFSGVNFNKNNLWTVGADYKYDNIKKTQINFDINFLMERLQRNVEINVQRDYFSLQSRWAFRLQYLNRFYTLNPGRRDNDSIPYLQATYNSYFSWASHALPVKNVFKNVEDENLAFMFSIKAYGQKFVNRPFITDISTDDVLVNYQNYLFGLGVARWDYFLVRNAYYLDVGEYLPRGYSASFWTGINQDEVYGNRKYLQLTFNYGIHLYNFGYFYPQASFKGYMNDKVLQQGLSRFSLDFLSKRIALGSKLDFRQTFTMVTQLGTALPEERKFSLSNESRGFIAPAFKGDRSYILKTESSWYVKKQVFSTSIAPYIFGETAWLGNISGANENSFFQYALGLGLRLRNIKVGVPYLSVHIAFYPKGNLYGLSTYNLGLLGKNTQAIQQNNMFTP
jgi:hypothetical protein